LVLTSSGATLGTTPESRRKKKVATGHNVRIRTVQFEHRPEKVHSYKRGGYLGIEHSHVELRDGPNA